MSRSNPTSKVSPVKHYFDWSGSEGKISFWNKDKKENVLFPTLKFVVLDELHTVAGFSDDQNTGIRGTEVKDLNTPITVYIGKKKYRTDVYQELKSITGLKYAKSVYIGILKKDAPMEIAKITFKGSSFSAWLNFLKGAEEYADKGAVDVLKVGIEIVGKSNQKKKGATKYYEPKFETFKLTTEQEDEAVDLDIILQSYFDTALNKTVVEQNNVVGDSPEEEEEDDQQDETSEDAEDVGDLPF